MTAFCASVDETVTANLRYPDRPAPTRSTVQRITSGAMTAPGSPIVHGPAADAAYAEAVRAGTPSPSACAQNATDPGRNATPAGSVSVIVSPYAVPAPALLQETAYASVVPAHTTAPGAAVLWIASSAGASSATPDASLLSPDSASRASTAMTR